MVRRFRCRERTGSPRIELTQLLLPLLLLSLKDQLYGDLARCEKKIHGSPLQQVTLSDWLYTK